MTYDPNNIFAKILRGEIPAKKVFENDYVLAFHDIAPRAPVHVLVVPKAAYEDMDDFSARASDAEISALMRAAGQIARDLGIDEKGYRLISNCRAHGGQEVPHLHFHLLGGHPLPRMIGD